MAYIRSCNRKYNTRSHSRKDKPLNEQTMSENLQIGLGRYVHDVQYSQTYDELDAERNVYHSSVMLITSNSSTNKK